MATCPAILTPLPDIECPDDLYIDAHGEWLAKLLSENEKIRSGYEQIRQGLKESLGITEKVSITFNFNLVDPAE